MSEEQVTRQILGNVPQGMVWSFYALTAAATAWAGWRFYRRFRARRAAPDRRHRPSGWHGLGRAALSALAYVTFQRQLLRDRFAGIAHLLTFHGFVVLFVGTCLVFLEHDTPLHFYYGWFYRIASLAIDLGGVAFMIGLMMFLFRRLKNCPSRILPAWWVALLAWLLLAIGVTGFLLEGARIARSLPDFEKWSIVGYAIAVLLRAAGLTEQTVLFGHRLLWGAHAFLCVGFFALLPWKFFSHMAYSLATWTTRSSKPIALLKAVDLASERPGATTAVEFSRLDLLQADGCTTCGRCNSVCPAFAAGKPLAPREVVLAIRQALDIGPTQSLAELIADDTLWSCTTCGACNAACPVGIDVYHKIIDMRRGRVEQGIVPPAAQQVFEDTASRFNPYHRPNHERLDFARGLAVPVSEPDEPIELLYWVGCAGSFDPDGQAVVRAMIRILNALGIRYRVLGPAERCTGDPARRLGEEGLFQELAQANLATFRNHGVQQILTHCPHCWNTFQNEYPQLSGDGAPMRRAIHHSQFLADLLAEGKLPLKSPLDAGTTFHDPCYLARGNGVVAQPRAVAQATAGKPLVEMPRHGRDSFCCGAGGGSMWLDVRGRERIEQIRLREAASTGAQTVATACPFCKTMLEAARVAETSDGSKASVRRVRDIAELVAEACGL